MSTAAARPRRRLSAWCSLEDFLTGKTVKADALLADVRPGGGRPIIDDLSLLRTIEEKAAKPPKLAKDGQPEEVELEIVFDDLTLQWATSAEKAATVRAVIDHCHQVLGVQVLVGLGHMDSKGTPIDLWLNLPVVESSPLDNSPRHDAFCNAILKFCEDHFPGYDGVSFDLEGVSVMGPFTKRKPKDEPDWHLYQKALAPGGEEAKRLEYLGHQETDFWTWRVTTNLTHLYRTLALKSTSPPLRPPSSAKDRGWDRIVAFAGAGVIGAVPPPPRNGPAPTTPATFYKSRLLEHDADGIKRVPGESDFVTKPGSLQPAEGTFRMHDYFGVRGVRNAIIRPMAYDIFQRNDPRVVLDDWHTDIVRYVKRVMNLHPGNFQLGVKTIDGPGQLVKGMDGVMKDPTWVMERCRDLLAPEDLGICLFPLSRAFWKSANDGLNPTNPFAGLAASTAPHPQTGVVPEAQPIQVPINAKAEAFYTPTKPAVK